ncbi:MAG TPA: patatin-like phospholipase family protein [Terracidiphilus sp.]|jgi:NTE family protein
MRNGFRIRAAFAGMAAAIAWTCLSEAHGAAPAPRIGLVLEGGSSLGLAHIGVIKWLEEHHVPVHYVAGTSMGGLIGGLYATGASPSEMDQLISQTDWNRVLRNDIPFRQLAYRRKEDARDYPNELEFGLKRGLKFPEGLNSGYTVGLILDRVALPYSQLASFNQLPIPFACVATDLVSGQQHVFRQGSLAMALRSTMSLPAVFSPVRTKSSIMVDGGLLNNLPVDVAKDMGADLIIAVHLQTKSTEVTDNLAALGVLGRSISVVIAANELRSMQKADILLTVPLQEFDSTDYAKSAEIIKLGYEAAASKAELLQRFAVDDATWQQYESDRASRRRTVSAPEFVEVTGTNPRLTKSTEKTLSKNVGELADPAELNNKLTTIFGSGRYSRVNYEGIERNGRNGLLVTVEEKSYAPPTVRPLLALSMTEAHRAEFGIGARITYLDLLLFGSEWRNDILLGTETLGRSAFYAPFGGSHQWFVEPSGFVLNEDDSFYHDKDLYADYRNRQVGGTFDFGHTFGLKSQLRAGYEFAHQWLVSTTKTTPYGEPSGRIGASSLSYHLLGRDDAIVPTRGTDLDAVMQWYDAKPGATEGFPAALAQVKRFQPITRHSSLFFAGSGGTTFGYEHTGLPPFSLGGLPDLPAYGSNEFVTNEFVLGKAGYIERVPHLPPLLLNRVAVLAVAEGGRVNYPQLDPAYPVDISGALVIKTMFGPMEMGAALGADGHHKFFYQIGRIF